MKRSALWKDIYREIWRSKSRFISIFMLIMLGVAFFSGLKATGPDMLLTANNYFNKYDLANFNVQSTYGIDQTDKQALEKVDGVEQVELGYTADTLMQDKNIVTKLYSMKADNQLNKYKVVTGRLPEKSGEIALDNNKLIHENVQLGDKVTFVKNDGNKLTGTLKESTFKVVGFVQSPAYIQKSERGASTVGKGKTEAFGVIQEQDFALPEYTIANLTFTNLASEKAFSDAYLSNEEKDKDNIEKALKNQPEKRLEKIKATEQQKLNDATKEINQGKAELKTNEAKLADAKAQLDVGFSKYEAAKKSYDTKISQGETEIRNGEAELASAKKQLDAAQPQITQGEAAIDQAEKELQEGQNTWEDANNLLNTTNSYLRNTRANLENALTQPDLTNIELDRASLLNSFDSIAKDLELSANERATYKATMNQLLTDYENGTISDQEIREGINAALAQVADAEKEYQAARATLDKEKQTIVQGQQMLANKRLELQKAKATYEAGLAKYQAGTKKLAAAKAQLAAGKEKGGAELQNALAKLNAGQAAYEKNLALFTTEKQKAEPKLASAEKEVKIGQEKLDTLELPKYYVLDRNDNPGYSEYKENADRLTSLSTAFPIFFFLIAALVCLTTMTRMVEEQRTQIGTLKAFGYSNGSIILKYLVYGSIASVIGSVLGILIGFQFFPNIIFNAYKSMYEMPPVDIGFYWSYSLLSLFVALFCTTFTAYVACRAELRANAATLMRPKAPKIGKRIFLERIQFIWKRMNFTSKVTARNLFRYKQRMLMTVLGVAGCTALILTGFGLRNSISDIAKMQYGQIMKYDAAVYQDMSAPPTAKETFDELMDDSNIKSKLAMSQTNIDTVKAGQSAQATSIIVPKNLNELPNYIVLRDRASHTTEKLTDDGAIITEKLAKLFDVKPGDTITVKNAENDKFQIKVSAITENYALHYIYMTPTYYQQIFKEKPVYNLDLLMLKDTSEKVESDFAEKLTDSKAVLNVTFSNNVSSMLTDTLDSLNIVIVVLITSAALLAFVVLYNLTNINVSERIRELSTIKVLGFYPKEVTMYVYRENIILTLMGIVTGFVLGFFLHRFIITTAEVDQMMFSPAISWTSYLFSGILTLVFATVVMVVMHIKLKRIDMIEALKSVE
ncbi:FtsX-like permease family protein [Listeria cossartiae subsp. cayugensis]|uniref:ABC transporter permease n=1 Tax=Listeria cossartiae TaxID=2838249 RepID=UPI00288089B0|nr:FtsX-like permease family protein [Listeria cossartiae]MDT0002826.1 FtsX-like permease family protein [Listeria cossartiae subsp. cayugensis]MDT0018806.1 FtsX-like permease family protein [Listeria cossartiae subsp. cayugensis]MDT0035621.1 FtsX-like permease family protein [Listeria cossartiae subsp. cayugensis]MDT0040556.1 FtsX-like permease family protein [Listeria cossartiae subsp. cayugensis]MDT0046323.1 FtsX-like permease family protein [Listeria cossartiae subsp. cayugensis]